MPIRVLLADDQVLTRQGIRALLSQEPDIEVVAEARSGQEAVQLALRHRPDVVLMDVVMEEGDGIEATRAIKQSVPTTQILILTVYADQDLFRQAVRAGAVGYVLKDISPQNLVKAIRAVHSGKTMVNPGDRTPAGGGPLPPGGGGALERPADARPHGPGGGRAPGGRGRAVGQGDRCEAVSRGVHGEDPSSVHLPEAWCAQPGPGGRLGRGEGPGAARPALRGPGCRGSGPGRDPTDPVGSVRLPWYTLRGGRLAQRESAALTQRRSEVRTLQRPPAGFPLRSTVRSSLPP
jgi:CheY-like chemotaxis protein